LKRPKKMDSGWAWIGGLLGKWFVKPT